MADKVFIVPMDKYNGIPYNQKGYIAGFRNDCSGLVSDILRYNGFAVPKNFTTGAIKGYVNNPNNEFFEVKPLNGMLGNFQPGDVLMLGTGHVGIVDQNGRIVDFGSTNSAVRLNGPTADSALKNGWYGLPVTGILRPKQEIYHPENDKALVKPRSDASDITGVTSELSTLNTAFVSIGDSDINSPYSGALSGKMNLWDKAIRLEYGDNVALITDENTGTQYLVNNNTNELLAVVSKPNGTISLISLSNNTKISVDPFGNATIENTSFDNNVFTTTLNSLDKSGNQTILLTTTTISNVENGIFTQVTQTLNSSGYITGVSVSGTDANGMNYFEVYGENGTLLSRTTTEIINGDYLKEVSTNYSSDGQPLESTSNIYDFDGNVVEMPTEPSALQNLINGFSDFRNDINNNDDMGMAINTYGPAIIDALSLVKAIQSGEPLPITASGLRLANDISMMSNNPNYVLSGAANAATGVLSLMMSNDALKSPT